MSEPLPPRPATSERRLLIEPFLERADRVVYVAIAVLFLLAAIAMGGYSVVVFIRNMNEDFPIQLVTFINDLLLVLIIMEVLGTVRSYLTTGTTSLTPFLYIGIISSTRRILAIGAQTTLGDPPTEDQFRHLMIDLGVNGAVVLALAIALFLFGRHQLLTGEPSHEATSDGASSPRWD